MIQLDKREAFPFSSNPFGLVYEMTMRFNHWSQMNNFI